MTDEERWKIEGRTRDALRQQKSRAALLEADLREHARALKEASEALIFFLSSPTGLGPTGMSKPEYLTHFHKSALSEEVERKIREFADASERIEALQNQVDRF